MESPSEEGGGGRGEIDATEKRLQRKTPSEERGEEKEELLVGVGPFFSSNHEKTTAADSPNHGSQAFAILTIHTIQAW